MAVAGKKETLLFLQPMFFGTQFCRLQRKDILCRFARRPTVLRRWYQNAPAPIPLGSRAAQKEFIESVQKANEPEAAEAAELSDRKNEPASSSNTILNEDGERVNVHTGEIGGPDGQEPTRFGDWEHNGRAVDF